MNILLIGQLTLHWGRLEFGNIGNYYIIEPFVRELHRVFPDATINTTFQMTKEFCERENINVLPMSLYYSWSEDDLDNALLELSSAYIFNKTGQLTKSTQFISAVLESDLVIDLSGDIWGDNADFLGEHRFLIGLIKNRTVQLLGKPIAMLAGSPGPFKNKNILHFAQEVYSHFDLVTNREEISARLLSEENFDLSKTKSLACPSFLFEPSQKDSLEKILSDTGLKERSNPVVGFIICGWNFEQGPFDKNPREDNEFLIFAETVEYLSEQLGLTICLMSHSNGFHVPPAEFKLIEGRDYHTAKQLYKVIKQRGIAKRVIMLEGVYSTWDTKALIGSFDMLVSGRIHAAVAALSQTVPTVILDYGHEPKAHKLSGFARLAQVEDCVVNPVNIDAIKKTINLVWENKEQYRKKLSVRIPEIKDMARQNFDLLPGILSERVRKS